MGLNPNQKYTCKQSSFRCPFWYPNLKEDSDPPERICSGRRSSLVPWNPCTFRISICELISAIFCVWRQPAIQNASWRMMMKKRRHDLYFFAFMFNVFMFSCMRRLISYFFSTFHSHLFAVWAFWWFYSRIFMGKVRVFSLALHFMSPIMNKMDHIYAILLSPIAYFIGSFLN